MWHLPPPSFSGSVSSGDLPVVCQSEAILPQPLAHFPQQLSVKPQGQFSVCSLVFKFIITTLALMTCLYKATIEATVLLMSVGYKI